jgi:hypothetical protein
MYPWAQKPPLHPDLHLHPDNPTLRDNNQLSGWFVPNPAQCTLCLKPNLKHRQIPHATFTILTTCPHGTGDDAPHNLSPNKAAAAILPYEDRQYACLGNLVVVKHPLADPAASNEDLPIVDLVRADFPFVDEMVRRYVFFP